LRLRQQSAFNQLNLSDRDRASYDAAVLIFNLSFAPWPPGVLVWQSIGKIGPEGGRISSNHSRIRDDHLNARPERTSQNAKKKNSKQPGTLLPWGLRAYRSSSRGREGEMLQGSRTKVKAAKAPLTLEVSKAVGARSPGLRSKPAIFESNGPRRPKMQHSQSWRLKIFPQYVTRPIQPIAPRCNLYGGSIRQFVFKSSERAIPGPISVRPTLRKYFKTGEKKETKKSSWPSCRSPSEVAEKAPHEKEPQKTARLIKSRKIKFRTMLPTLWSRRRTWHLPRRPTPQPK